ncbi:MAG: Hpt domain-containing protein [Verrucomicrobiota bacterium]
MPISAELFSPRILRTFAEEICADDADIFVELLSDCQNDLRAQCEVLLEAREAENWRDFNRAAHSIKSAARTFGSPLLKELAFTLEAHSEGEMSENDLQVLDRHTERLQRASQEFKDALERIAADADTFLA